MTPASWEALKAQLERDEDRRSRPYHDTAGKLTIGIGHNLTDLGIPDPVIDALSEYDISRTIRDLDRHLPWWRDRSEIRQQVLANMAFNMGIGTLLGFHRTLALMQQDDPAAGDEMLRSQWAWEVGDRATRLAQMWRTNAPVET